MEEEYFEKMWELQQARVKRQEAVDKFCDACAALPRRDRRKVERFLAKRANPKTGAEQLWSKSEMRACYEELWHISQKVATAWRRCALGSMEVGLSRCYVCFNFQVLADSLECWMWMENSSDD